MFALLSQQVAILSSQLLDIHQISLGLQCVNSVLVIIAGQFFVCELEVSDSVFQLVD